MHDLLMFLAIKRGNFDVENLTEIGSNRSVKLLDNTSEANFSYRNLD